MINNHPYATDIATDRIRSISPLVGNAYQDFHLSRLWWLGEKLPSDMYMLVGACGQPANKGRWGEFLIQPPSRELCAQKFYLFVLFPAFFRTFFYNRLMYHRQSKHTTKPGVVEWIAPLLATLDGESCSDTLPTTDQWRRRFNVIAGLLPHPLIFPFGKSFACRFFHFPVLFLHRISAW